MTMKQNSVQWQPVPGADGVRFLPFELPPAAGSTVYLLAYPELFLLIDLGMDEPRIGKATEVINDLDPGHVKPLLVILTHCHIDHIAAAKALAGVAPRSFGVSGHAAGRATLARQDEAATASYLFRCIPPAIDVAVPLFSTKDRSSLPDSGLPSLRLSESLIDPASGLSTQDILVGNQLVARAYATPGHTPDSICLRVGNLFFCGDLPFAGNPGVAGTPGWNRGELLISLDAVAGLMEESTELAVCAGHGRLLERGPALALFAAARSQAASTRVVAVLDAERSAFLKGYAQVLLRELSSTFTILAGRLLLVADQLESLDEIERSRRIRESALFTAIDQLIEQYARSAARDDQNGEPDMRLPLAAGSILAKLEKMLADRLFTEIIDPVRLRRAHNLILDFTNALRGISYRHLLRPESPAGLVEAFLADVAAPNRDERCLLAAAEDHDAFMAQLMRRLAFRPLFAGVTFTSLVSAGLPPVAVVREHLLDTLTGLGELLVVAGGRRIMIDAAAEGEEVYLALSAAVSGERMVISEGKIAFYRMTLQLYGARFSVEQGGETLTFSLNLPVAEWFDEPLI